MCCQLSSNHWPSAHPPLPCCLRSLAMPPPLWIPVMEKNAVNFTVGKTAKRPSRGQIERGLVCCGLGCKRSGIALPLPDGGDTSLLRCTACSPLPIGRPHNADGPAPGAAGARYPYGAPASCTVHENEEPGCRACARCFVDYSSDIEEPKAPAPTATAPSSSNVGLGSGEIGSLALSGSTPSVPRRCVVVPGNTVSTSAPARGSALNGWTDTYEKARDALIGRIERGAALPPPFPSRPRTRVSITPADIARSRRLRGVL